MGPKSGLFKPEARSLRVRRSAGWHDLRRCFDHTLYAIDPAGRKKWGFVAGKEIKHDAGHRTRWHHLFRELGLQPLCPRHHGTRKWAFGTGFFINSSPAVAAEGQSILALRTASFTRSIRTGLRSGTIPFPRALIPRPPLVRRHDLCRANDRQVYALNPNGTKEVVVPDRGCAAPGVAGHRL